MRSSLALQLSLLFVSSCISWTIGGHGPKIEVSTDLTPLGDITQAKILDGVTIIQDSKFVSNTMYVVNGLLIGDYLGRTNNTPYVIDNNRQLSALLKRDVPGTISRYSVAIIQLSAAASIVAGIACCFVKACPPAVTARLASFGTTPSAVIGIAESAAGVGKRQTAQYEKWGCSEANGGIENMCTVMSQNDFVTPIGNGEGDANGSGPDQSIYLVSEDGKIGTIIGYIYHCIDQGGSCTLPSDGAISDTGPESDFSE